MDKNEHVNLLNLTNPILFKPESHKIEDDNVISNESVDDSLIHYRKIVMTIEILENKWDYLNNRIKNLQNQNLNYDSSLQELSKPTHIIEKDKIEIEYIQNMIKVNEATILECEKKLNAITFDNEIESKKVQSKYYEAKKILELDSKLKNKEKTEREEKEKKKQEENKEEEESKQKEIKAQMRSKVHFFLN